MFQFRKRIAINIGNTNRKRQNSSMNQNEIFDAIVVGTGISGGWAAKELTENGLKTLVLERGRMVKHVADYPTMNKDPGIFLTKGNYHRRTKKSTMCNRVLIGRPKRITSIFL